MHEAFGDIAFAEAEAVAEEGGAFEAFLEPFCEGAGGFTESFEVEFSERFWFEDTRFFRGDAAAAIAAIGPDAAAAVPILVKMLADEGAPLERYPAAYALGRIGPAAKPAVEQLRALATSSDEVLVTVALWASLKINPEDRSLLDQAVPALRKALRAEREIVRLEAAVALGEIGAAAAPTIPMLELVSEEDPSKPVRAAAAAALVKIKGS